MVDANEASSNTKQASMDAISLIRIVENPQMTEISELQARIREDRIALTVFYAGMTDEQRRREGHLRDFLYRNLVAKHGLL